MEALLQLNIHGYNLIMVPWNIFLALIPCIVAYYMTKGVGKRGWEKLGNQKIAFVLLFLFWLFFFPNTAYLFMIVRHLVNYCDDFDKYRVCLDGSWKVMFFFVYAAIGIPTFYYALNKMEKLFRSMCGKAYATALPIFVIPITTIAVMFGLYSRYNSWDVLFRPTELLKTVTTYFTEIHLLTDFIVITVILYLIYYVTRGLSSS
ncbi:DUF1361 domain-containing protein [Patescibacteria group bacterium]|nr:DUF1361 domain-containing protein [Patescibacteria group bacterium]